jgi:hypothetical protein
MHVLASAFTPGSKENAIFFIAAVACFGLAAFASAAARRIPGGALSLVAIGLALWLWPTMWNAADVAFR